MFILEWLSRLHILFSTTVYSVSLLTIDICVIHLLYDAWQYLRSKQVAGTKAGALVFFISFTLFVATFDIISSLTYQNPPTLSAVTSVVLASFAVSTIGFLRSSVLDRLDKIIHTSSSMPSCVCDSLLTSKTLKIAYYKNTDSNEFVLQSVSAGMHDFLTEHNIPVNIGSTGLGSPLLESSELKRILSRNTVLINKGSSTIQDVVLLGNTFIDLSFDAVLGEDNTLTGCIVFITRISTRSDEAVQTERAETVPTNNRLDIDLDDLVSQALVLDTEIRNNKLQRDFLQSVFATIPDTAMFVVTEQNDELIVYSCGGELLKNSGWDISDIVGKPLRFTLADKPVLKELLPLYERALSGHSGKLVHFSSTTKNNHLIRVEPFQFSNKQYALGVTTIVP